ncbi:MAG: glutamate--cysteine ligase [Alphaproteobacteria bacterium]|nr:glutamate--cysteine ligase [Alphaproteobacteria bacterium]MBF0130288.1 glutamate--cysteine ligase [Alphaproteobacteria bacterium]
MSGPAKGTGEPITDRRQLIDYMFTGCRPPAEWRIGTEHERFAFTKEDCRPLPYEGERGVRAILEGLQRFGWEPVNEGETLIALKRANNSSITLEPGGQLELSGAPLETIHQTCTEVTNHHRQVDEVAGPLGIALLGMGFQPKWRREDVPWMPKGRYRIMKAYMPKVGSLGLDMMLRTCTVQVNLDFSSERDMVRKFRASLALQPVATALWASSPFTEGKPNGFLSYRSHIWTDTDPARCGMLPFVFEDGMGFERYVDYMLDVPMYFVYRDGRYIDASGLSFRDFMAGKLAVLPGEFPTDADWADHLTTAFPEVRLKRYLEMRGADGGPWGRLCALPALWTGLLYTPASLDAAMDLIGEWGESERESLRRDVPKLGLKAMVGGRAVREVALDMLDIAREGLRLRARLNFEGSDESIFLKPLFEIAESGKTPAEEMLESFHGRWGGRVDPAFAEHAN